MTAVMRRADAVRPSALADRSAIYTSRRRESRKRLSQHTRVYHDKEFHEAIIDIAWRSRLEDENIFVSYRFAYGDAGFLVRVVQTHSLRGVYAQPVRAFQVRPSPLPVSTRRERKQEADRLATNWASMGWEFPLRSLISFDMVDMVEEKSSLGGAAP